MIYCFCDQCGMSFRKGRYKHPKCLRCGNPDLWEEDIPAEELTLVDRVVDEMLREEVRSGGRRRK